MTTLLHERTIKDIQQNAARSEAKIQAKIDQIAALEEQGGATERQRSYKRTLVDLLKPRLAS